MMIQKPEAGIGALDYCIFMHKTRQSLVKASVVLARIQAYVIFWKE
jgi:hypothetical protein